MSRFPFQGVVFDADGTLFDTEQLARAVWLSVAREWGAAAIEAHYMELIGRNREGIVSLLRSVCPPGFPLEEFLLTCSQRSRARMEREGVPLKEGAREILAFLAQRNIPVALATSSGAATTRYKLERTGVDRYFRAVVTGDMVSHSKPHPEIYQNACSLLAIDPARALAMEDSPNGILSAHAAGMAVAMVPDLIPPTPELEALLWGRFDSLTALREYLEGM